MIIYQLKDARVCVSITYHFRLLYYSHHFMSFFHKYFVTGVYAGHFAQTNFHNPGLDPTLSYPLQQDGLRPLFGPEVICVWT